MIEIIRNNTFEIAFYFMLFLVICSFIVTHIQMKEREKLFKEYEELADKHDDVLFKYWEQSVEVLSLLAKVEFFIEEHNSWHDRKIAFYYDKDGWHCCYADEMPQGDTFITEEEITLQNEKNNENQQSI